MMNIAIHRIKSITTDQQDYPAKEGHAKFSVIGLSIVTKDGPAYIQLFSDEPISWIGQTAKEATNG